MQTKQQERAHFALENLPWKDAKREKVDKDTATFIVGSPTMILTNGLGQAMAFMLSKKGSDKNAKEGKVFDILKKWLCTEMQSQLGNADANDLDFLRRFNTIDQQHYIQAQNEALRFLEWMKRYARAFQEEEKKS